MEDLKMKTKNNEVLLDEATIRFIVEKVKELMNRIFNIIKNFNLFRTN